MYMLLLKMNLGVIVHLNIERYTCVWAALSECNVDPRLCKMTAGNEDNILHSIDPKAKTSSECKPRVDVLDHPITEITESGCVFTLRWDRKRQQSASPAIARKGDS